MNAIVTGASSGIGKAIALRLNQLNYRIFSISRDIEKVRELSVLLREPEIIHGDLRNRSDVDKLNQSITDKGIVPDLIVNCAGIYTENLPSELTEDGLNALLGDNFWGAFRITQSWLDAFRRRKSGTIITIGSVVNHSPRLSASGYTLSKKLLDEYMLHLGMEMRDYGVRVCRINPGSVNSPSWGNAPDLADEMVQPEQIGDLVEEILGLPHSAWLEEVIIRPLRRDI